ncbi:hypothetical protein [Calidithermus roseus]|uniref:Uncharacterized protein n=1 Tax=Calidithermus roseus TaxID=1644118 RepID=A0A399EZ75_9DEIN|nr:hypothetical protein [Calidithermus roseus]RIH89854.1 hypothetical protein Mrose_00079 [Calidithermus roseus]
MPKTQAYAASWANWLISRWDALGMLFWLPYLGLFVLLALAVTLAKWWDGSLAVGQFLPLQILAASYVPWGLLLIRYLIRAAQEALENIQPTLEPSEADYQELRYQLSVAPAVPTLAATLIGAGFGMFYWLVIMQPVHPFILWGSSRLSLAIDLGIAFLIWAVLGTLFFIALRQSRTLQQIYSRIEQINLMLPQPLYALSNHTLVAAVGGTLINYVWFAVLSLTITHPPPAIIAVSLGIEAIIVMVFVLPLWSIHILLLEEKHRLQGLLNERLRKVTTDLHQTIDAGMLEKIDPVQKALSSIQIQQAVLDRVSTWPWQPETFRILSTAIAAPLLIWLVQRILSRLFT